MARVLGVDVGETTIRGALLKTSFRKSEVLQYIHVAIPPHDPAAEDERAGALAQAMDELIYSVKPPPDSVVAHLSGALGSVREISLPIGAAKRAADILPAELDSQVPFDMDEAVVAYQPMGTSDGEITMLTVAVPKDRISERVVELGAAKLHPRELVPGALSFDGLPNVFEPLGFDGPQLVLSMDAKNTELCVFQDGVCTLARTISQGHADIRVHPETGDIHAPRLALELKRTLTMFRASGGGAFDNIYLVGEAVGFHQLFAWLAEVVGGPVSLLPLPEAAGATDQNVGLFARAVGLAARTARRGKRVNLLVGEFAPARSRGGLTRYLPLVAACAVLVLLAFCFATYAKYSALSARKEALQEQLAGLTEVNFGREVRSASLAKELLSTGDQLRDPLPSFDGWDVLEMVSNAIPNEITHDTRSLRIEVQDETREAKAILKGTVADVTERDTIAAALLEHRCVVELEKGRTTPGRGNERMNYQLTIEIQCPEDAPPPEDEDEGRRNR